MRAQSQSVKPRRAKVFTESDFNWANRPKLAKHKKVVVASFNLVRRQNARCGGQASNTDEVYISPSRGSASSPVFFVTCGDIQNAFNVYFSKADVEKGTLPQAEVENGRLPGPDARADAAMLCLEAIEKQATFPSSVDASLLLGTAMTGYSNGNVRVTMEFTAKNALGVVLPYTAHCLMASKRSGGKSELVIKPR